MVTTSRSQRDIYGFTVGTHHLKRYKEYAIICEKLEATLSTQKKFSTMWERRARELGWRDKPSAHSNFFDRIGLFGVVVVNVSKIGLGFLMLPLLMCSVTILFFFLLIIFIIISR